MDPTCKNTCNCNNCFNMRCDLILNHEVLKPTNQPYQSIQSDLKKIQQLREITKMARELIEQSK